MNLDGKGLGKTVKLLELIFKLVYESTYLYYPFLG